MTISIPYPAVFVSSDVTDSTMEFQDLVHNKDNASTCWRTPITPNLEVRDGDWIYIYTGKDTLWIPKYDDTNSNYEIGQLVLDTSGTSPNVCRIMRITNKKTTKGQPSVPLEPEEYTSGHETSLSNWESWTKRYYAHTAGAAINHKVGNLWFTIGWYNCPNICNGGGWLWTTHDLRDTCGSQTYFNSCMKTSSRFKSSTDIRADKFNWGAPGQTKVPALKMKSMIHRNGYYYYRTWVDIPPEKTPEVDDTTTYTLSEVTSPGEIDGFVKLRLVNQLAPFDDKNYTKAEWSPSNNKTNFTFDASKNFDTIAIGRVIADSISILIKNPDTGVILGTISDYPIDNSIGDNITVEQAVTVVLYTVEPYPKRTRISVTFNGSKMEVGTLKVGMSIDAGFTNTKFDNWYKDFSPKEQDQWGNITYKNGVRVYMYSGTVDMPTSYYDTISRIFMNIGAQEMIINGSDSFYNTPPNSLTIFQSSMMIGRITSFKQSTKTVGGLMDNIATYSFQIEESV